MIYLKPTRIQIHWEVIVPHSLEVPSFSQFKSEIKKRYWRGGNYCLKVGHDLKKLADEDIIWESEERRTAHFGFFYCGSSKRPGVKTLQKEVAEKGFLQQIILDLDPSDYIHVRGNIEFGDNYLMERYFLSTSIMNSSFVDESIQKLPNTKKSHDSLYSQFLGYYVVRNYVFYQSLISV